MSQASLHESLLHLSPIHYHLFSFTPLFEPIRIDASDSVVKQIHAIGSSHPSHYKYEQDAQGSRCSHPDNYLSFHLLSLTYSSSSDTDSLSHSTSQPSSTRYLNFQYNHESIVHLEDGMALDSLSQYHLIASDDELHLLLLCMESCMSLHEKLFIKPNSTLLPNSYTTLRPKLPVEAPKIVTFSGFWDIRPPSPTVPGITSQLIARYSSFLSTIDIH